MDFKLDYDRLDDDDMNSKSVQEEDMDNTSTEESFEYNDIRDMDVLDRVTDETSNVSDEDWVAFENMIRYSFPPSILLNLSLMQALRKAYSNFGNHFRLHSDPSTFHEIRMRSLLHLASRCYCQNIEKINWLDDERLCFEAAALLLFSRNEHVLTSGKYILNTADFYNSYPEFHPVYVGKEESTALLDFRNMMKIGMALIPPLHNKTHLLHLVTRLLEGANVRHVTGTGATKATKARVEIILKEGDLVVPKRPPRYNSCNTKDSSARKRKAESRHDSTTATINSSSSSNAICSDFKRKRGRPRKDLIPTGHIITGGILRNQESISPRTADNGAPSTIPSVLSILFQYNDSATKPLDCVPSRLDNSVNECINERSPYYDIASDNCKTIGTIFPLESARSSSCEMFNWKGLDPLASPNDFNPLLLRQTSLFSGVELLSVHDTDKMCWDGEL